MPAPVTLASANSVVGLDFSMTTRLRENGQRSRKQYEG